MHNAAISNDCKLVAVTSATGIEIQSIFTPSDSVKSIKTQSFNIDSLAFSPESAYIAARYFDKLKIWPVRSGEPTLTLLATARPWMGKYTVDIRNADTGAPVQVIRLGMNIIHLSFEPNSNSVLRTNLGRIKLKDFYSIR